MLPSAFPSEIGTRLDAVIQQGLASKIRHDWESSAFEQAFQSRQRNDEADVGRPDRSSVQGFVAKALPANGGSSPRTATVVPPQENDRSMISKHAVQSDRAVSLDRSVSGAISGMLDVSVVRTIDSAADESLDTGLPSLSRGRDAPPAIRLALSSTGDGGLHVTLGTDGLDGTLLQSVLETVRRECAWSGVALASLKVNGRSLDVNAISTNDRFDDVVNPNAVNPLQAERGNSHGS